MLFNHMLFFYANHCKRVNAAHFLVGILLAKPVVTGCIIACTNMPTNMLSTRTSTDFINKLSQMLSTLLACQRSKLLIDFKLVYRLDLSYLLSRFAVNRFIVFIVCTVCFLALRFYNGFCTGDQAFKLII